jgi:hypothetical protein
MGRNIRKQKGSFSNEQDQKYDRQWKFIRTRAGTYNRIIKYGRFEDTLDSVINRIVDMAEYSSTPSNQNIANYNDKKEERPKIIDKSRFMLGRLGAGEC